MRTRSTLRPVFAVIALAAVTTASFATSAADPKSAAAPAATTSPAQQADDLFLKGKALLKEGKKQDALAAYRSAFELRKSYDVAGNLGSLELELGLFRDAAEHLGYALAHYAPTGTTQEQLAKAKQRFDQARKEVCGVRLTASVDGAEVFVDGASIGRAPITEEVFVTPGARKIEARFPGYVTATKTLEAKKGAAEEVKLSLEREVVAPTAIATATAAPMVVVPQRSLVPTFVIGGAGVVALAVGAGLMVGYANEADTATKLKSEILAAKHSCVAGAANFDARCTDVESATRNGDTLNRAGIGVLIGGGVLAAGALAWWLWPQRTGTAMRVAPVITPSAVGLTAIGSF